MKPSMTAGQLVIAMIAELEKQGVPTVYLRNYENLPTEVGNDVDLLVPTGKRKTAANVLAHAAHQNGWIFLGCGHFSPLAVYFANPETTETLHLDLFDRIEWHFVEFAAASKILARRRFNGLVHIPAAEDEIYLNLATRLIYQGKIREKHRLQAAAFTHENGGKSLTGPFLDHLGNPGLRLEQQLVSSQWQASAAARRTLIGASSLNHGLIRPWRLLTGLLRYALRIVRKIALPPGRFIVLEGADGSGKSTVMKEILPWCAKWNAGRDTFDFHWKPTRLHSGDRIEAPSVDPRGRELRPPLISLAYLAYHILGYWWGWIFRIRPLLSKSHAVVGDRYSYDIYLDPARFRLSLPSSLCRFAAMLTPRPDIVVGLIAPPEMVHQRKPELSLDEIAAYQSRWQSLARSEKNFITVSADGTADEVCKNVKQAILTILAKPETRLP